MPPEMPSAPRDEASIGIEQVAADWMIRRDRGLSSDQQAELAHWLAADERHRAAFKALDATWALMGEARRAPSFEVAGTGSRRGWLRWVPVTLAAAAAVVGGIFWISDGGAGLPAGDGSYAASATTQVGALREMLLPDRSVVRLNTDSEIDVQYTAAERRVSLRRGEAHFTVAKNPARPFFVVAGEVELRAVGTAFNVRLRPATVEVLVTAGIVSVSPPPAQAASAQTAAVVQSPAISARTTGDIAPPLLVAGQRLVVPLVSSEEFELAPSVPATLPPQAIRQTLAWQQRRLDFESTPLPEMVSEINRYNSHKLVIVDPRLDTRRFGGSFPAGDYEAFVRLLETNFGVVAQRNGDETLLRLAP